MEINSITFRRKVNTGNFESFDVEATATSVVAEDAKAAARALQAYVDQICAERIDTLRRPGARGGKDAPEFPEL